MKETGGARILHLTTEFPWPVRSGGTARTLSQLELLASLPEVERVTLLSVSERTVSVAEQQALVAAVPKLTVLPPVAHPVHLWRHTRHVPRVLCLRLFGVPYLAAKWDSPRLRDALREQLRTSAADIIYVDHLGMARYLADIRASQCRPRLVLEEHNVESELFGQLAGQRGGIPGRIARAEWRLAARFEQSVLEAVDAVVAISQTDADCLKNMAHVSVHVAPVVVDVTRRVRPRPRRPHFCYVGSLGWRPNATGLDWFCQTVWPRVLARIPDATMEIAGVGLATDEGGRARVPDAWIAPGINTVGFVPDLEPLYARSLAVVAPVMGGSGVRIKVLEALRAGLPIVTTPDGARGLGLTDGRNALIAHEPEGFAERMERLASDEYLGIRLREEGYDYLETRHSRAVARTAMRRALGFSEESLLAVHGTH